jgi:hypothetical protein
VAEFEFTQHHDLPGVSCHFLSVEKLAAASVSAVSELGGNLVSGMINFLFLAPFRFSKIDHSTANI